MDKVLEKCCYNCEYRCDKYWEKIYYCSKKETEIAKVTDKHILWKTTCEHFQKKVKKTTVFL